MDVAIKRTHTHTQAHLSHEGAAMCFPAVTCDGLVVVKEVSREILASCYEQAQERV